MADVQNTLNNDEFFVDIDDTSENTQKKEWSVWVYTILRVVY